MIRYLKPLAQFECLLIAGYHILIGCLASVSPASAAGLAPLMYGVSLDSLGPMRPEYELIIRFIGAFALSFGVVAAFAAWRPERARWIIFSVVVFFAIRVLDRFIGWDALIGTLGSSAERNVAQIALMLSFIVVLGAYLLFGRPSDGQRLSMR